MRRIVLPALLSLLLQARSLGEVVDAMGLPGCDALGACLGAGARALLAALQHAAQSSGERKLVLQVSGRGALLYLWACPCW